MGTRPRWPERRCALVLSVREVLPAHISEAHACVGAAWIWVTVVRVSLIVIAFLNSHNISVTSSVHCFILITYSSLQTWS